MKMNKPAQLTPQNTYIRKQIKHKRNPTKKQTKNK
jgi:hypothetical protein